jgi:hypothetical protein
MANKLFGFQLAETYATKIFLGLAYAAIKTRFWNAMGAI